jgi:hypothetical protein
MSQLSSEPDVGYFSTTSVRPCSPSHKSSRGLTSRIITFPKGNYSRPPNIAGGFSQLELAIRIPNDDEETENWRSVDGIRANVVGSRISKDSFRIGLETWDGGVMLAAAACWLEHKSGAKECVFGQFDTHEVITMWRKKQREQALERRRAKQERYRRRMERSRRQSLGRSSIDTTTSFSAILSSESPVSSPQAMSSTTSDSESEVEETPELEDEVEGSDLPTTYHHTVHFPNLSSTPRTIITWLNRLDFPYPSTSYPSSFRLSCTAKNTSPTSSTLVLSTSSADSSKRSTEMAVPLLGGALCYIAYPSNKPYVASGKFSVTSHTTKRSHISGRVTFPPNVFADNKTPTVLAALSGFECPADVEALRVGVKVKWTTSEAFGWEILGPQLLGDMDHASKTDRKGGRWRVEVNWIAMGFV